jgi:hypothetical protein
MTVHVVYDTKSPYLGGNLNMRQLLTPLFYDGCKPWLSQTRHPDRKRQRSARLKARALRQARELKTAYVPLVQVDPACYITPPWIDGNGSLHWSTEIIELPKKYGSDYRRRVRASCVEVDDAGI